MKINLGKLLSILSQVVAAAPTVIEAVKPIIHEVKGKPAASEPVAVSKGVSEASTANG